MRELSYNHFPSLELVVQGMDVLFKSLMQISLASKVVIYIHNNMIFPIHLSSFTLLQLQVVEQQTLVRSPFIVSYYFTMQPEQIDPQKLKRLQNLWKVFGRETKAGKEMFDLYNIAEKPKLDYPKPKPKSQKEIDAEKQKLIANKKCPQKTVIEYPQLPRPERPALHPVDFIPKRKNESVIRKEIQEYYQHRARNIPANRGVDRANLVKKLQEKFKMQRGILPKSVQLPGLDVNTKFDEELIKQNAKMKVDKKGQNYTQPLKKEEKKEGNKDLKSELNDLFDQIVAEIDERQQYLDSIDHLDEPKLKEKIKREMIERVAQLQKITQLKK